MERTGQIEEGRAGQRVPVPQGQALAGLDDEGARGPQRRGRTGCRRAEGGGPSGHPESSRTGTREASESEDGS